MLTALSMPAGLRFFPLGVSGWGGPPLPLVPHRRRPLLLDSLVLSLLVSSSPSPREKQRLSRVSQPHASSWVTAVPSTVDGPDAIIRPMAFRVACYLRLGLPVSRGGVPCPSCTHTFLDQYGDHAICCTSTGDLIVRHNRMRDLVDNNEPSLREKKKKKKSGGNFGANSAIRPLGFERQGISLKSNVTGSIKK